MVERCTRVSSCLGKVCFSIFVLITPSGFAANIHWTVYMICALFLDVLFSSFIKLNIPMCTPSKSYEFCLSAVFYQCVLFILWRKALTLCFSYVKGPFFIMIHHIAPSFPGRFYCSNSHWPTLCMMACICLHLPLPYESEISFQIPLKSILVCLLKSYQIICRELTTYKIESSHPAVGYKT